MIRSTINPDQSNKQGTKFMYNIGSVITQAVIDVQRERMFRDRTYTVISKFGEHFIPKGVSTIIE
jgi:hypothetical protein